MARSKALLIAADSDSELAKVISQSECGLISSYDDVQAIVANIKEMQSMQAGLENMGLRGSQAVQQFDRETILSDWRNSIGEVIHNGNDDPFPILLRTTSPMTSRVRNDLFDPHKGFERQASTLKFIAWLICRWFFFTTAFPWPSKLKFILLRVFGAKIGEGVYIKPRVNILFHGNYRSLKTAGWEKKSTSLTSNPYRSEQIVVFRRELFFVPETMIFATQLCLIGNAPITIESGVWLGANSLCGPGITVGEDCVLLAGSVLVNSSPRNQLLRGNPAQPCGLRWKDEPPT